MKKWMLIAIFILIGLGLIGCTQNTDIAKAEITSFVTDAGPLEQYITRLPLSNPSPNDQIYFYILVTPINPTPNQTYYVMLLSQDNYVYSVTPISWTTTDLSNTPLDPNERNTTIISQQKQLQEAKKFRNVTLTALISDKDIAPIVEAYGKLWQERYNDALKSKEGIHIGVVSGASLGKYALTDKDYQNLSKTHVKVIIADQNTYFQLGKDMYNKTRVK